VNLTLQLREVAGSTLNGHTLMSANGEYYVAPDNASEILFLPHNFS